MEKRVLQNITSAQRMAAICFLIIFAVALIMVILSSIGTKIDNFPYWSDLLKTMTGGIIGYLFGANMKKDDVSSTK
ncbi:hypothetical protein [Nitrosarchaeum sp. AC2]|uniref:hypothetical protein n=1 Tax=Nitrosarchaeum sp. AC2 TaxID=2259673 RepID=UPI0015CD746D|nr:hypothetical protein [Nitrosarchaeum sp. AC2]QLH11477.1 hypothetical protein DSQ20_08525 [Nitrosarchaeum sp. AC2]